MTECVMVTMKKLNIPTIFYSLGSSPQNWQWITLKLSDGAAQNGVTLHPKNGYTSYLPKKQKSHTD